MKCCISICCVLQAGRLLGYTLALFFALASLFNILRTFKRILLHRYLKSLRPQQQDELIQELKQIDGIEGGALARAMTLLRNRDHTVPYGEHPGSISLTSNHHGQAEPYTHSDLAVTIPPSTDQHHAAYADSYTDYNSFSNGSSAAGQDTDQATAQIRRKDTWSQVAAAEAAAAMAAASAVESAASMASQLSVQVPQKTNGPSGALPSGDHVLGLDAHNQGATTEIMYTIQMLEVSLVVAH